MFYRVKSVWVYQILMLCGLINWGCKETQTINDTGMEKENELIEATLKNYMDGGTLGNKEQLRSAFHTDASIKFIKEGDYHQATLEEFMTWPNAGQKQDRECRIVAFDYRGDIGTAQLILEYETFRFIDFFNLMKVDGQWLIVDKVFYREEK